MRARRHTKATTGENNHVLMMAGGQTNCNPDSLQPGLDAIWTRQDTGRPANRFAWQALRWTGLGSFTVLEGLAVGAVHCVGEDIARTAF